MSSSGKLHCVLIETFSHSSRRIDWFRPIGHGRGHCCIATRLNTVCPLDKACIRNFIPAILNQPCILPANRKSRNFRIYLFLFIFSKLGGVQPKFLPVLIHNIESTRITQLIVDNIKVRPFLRDAMYNVSKFLRKENFNANWSKQ